ncbi:tetratricopeptide repeat protein [uncultured Parabacteroides sp.]|jgi:tetratricopeptide (TPR) repeat protein|uniref:tetratricopeptide repeat protein n=1 Tax=uncultured Parabacteroides sp. TaxID=512312 RepID=UPI0025D6DA36|nr:tetratricopeptide repeat protein [uncultured Parabacteroides sp.]
MKKLLLHITSLVSIVLFLFMSACNNHPQAPMLLEAEKIIEEQPDSALSILNKIENVNQLSEKDHATYCLLLTQAQDLNYITHTSDSLIKIAATYFEKNKDKPCSMLAYYYLGRVNSDLQDALQAQEYYLKALEIGDDSKDYTLLIKIYNNLGTLYAYQDINDMALPMYKKVLSYLELKPDSVKTAFALRNIARIFSQTHQLDSAITYYKKAISFSTPKNKAAILIDLGNLYLNAKKYDIALRYMNEAITLTTNKKTLLPIYLSKGELFIAINNMDSAKSNLNRCINSSNIYTQAGALHLLAQVAQKERNFDNFSNYFDQCEFLRDSIKEYSHFENIRLTQSMFNYQQLSKEKNKFEKEADQRMILIYQVIIIFTTIFILSFIFFKKEQHRKKKLADIKEEQYKRSQQYIEDNKRQILQLTEKLYSKQEEMSEVQRQLYETRKLMLEMENRQIFEKQGTFLLLEKDFHNSSLYIRIHREDGIQLGSSEWEELHQLIDATYPDFTNRLILLYPQISIEEIHICYLVKMHIPIKKIAFIMHITSSGVSQCRRRLYKKFTGEPQNTEKFDKFIIDF